MNIITQIHVRFRVPAALVACALAVAFAVPALAQTGESSIEGVVFLDDNGDGQLAATEEGLGSFTVELEREDGSKASAQTDSNGLYRFRNLEAGRYTVRLVDRAGYEKTGVDLYLNLDLKEDGESIEGVDFAVGESDEEMAEEDEVAEDEEADEEDMSDEASDEGEDEEMAEEESAEEDGLDAMAAAAAAAAAGGELPAGVDAELSDMIASLDEAEADALADALADRDAAALAAAADALDDAQRATLVKSLADTGNEDLAEAVFMGAMAEDDASMADEEGDDEKGDDGDTDDEDDADADDADAADADDAGDADATADDGDDDDDETAEEDEVAADGGDDDADDEDAPDTMPEAGLADLGGAGMLALLAALLAIFGGFGLMRERALY